MKVKIIPETDVEKQKIEVIEHEGIREFLLFGKKVDADGMAVDVHEWTGSYRYLIGSMEFFVEVLHDERRERNNIAREREALKSVTNGDDTSHSIPELKVLKVDGSGADVPNIDETQTPSK
jgi:hypothetical protein